MKKLMLMFTLLVALLFCFGCVTPEEDLDMGSNIMGFFNINSWFPSYFDVQDILYERTGLENVNGQSYANYDMHIVLTSQPFETPVYNIYKRLGAGQYSTEIYNEPLVYYGATLYMKTKNIPVDDLEEYYLCDRVYNCKVLTFPPYQNSEVSVSPTNLDYYVTFVNSGFRAFDTREIYVTNNNDYPVAVSFMVESGAVGSLVQDNPPESSNGLNYFYMDDAIPDYFQEFSLLISPTFYGYETIGPNQTKKLYLQVSGLNYPGVYSPECRWNTKNGYYEKVISLVVGNDSYKQNINVSVTVDGAQYTSCS